MVNIILYILVAFIYMALGYSFPRASIAFLVILIGGSTEYKNAVASGILIGLILRDAIDGGLIGKKK